MNLSEPFELSRYSVKGGGLLSPSLVLGVETLRNDGDTLFYADANVTVSTRGHYVIKNPIAYKTLRQLPIDKIKIMTNPLLADFDIGAISILPCGRFTVRLSDGVFYYTPEYKRGDGVYVAREIDELKRLDETGSDRYGARGRYQIGTHEYVIGALTNMDDGRRILMRGGVYSELKNLLDTRKIENTNGR